MGPNDLSNLLRKIAKAIETSRSPSKDRIASDLSNIVRIAQGPDKGTVEYLMGFDMREPLIHALIMAFNEADSKALKDVGYSSLSQLEKDDSDAAKKDRAWFEKVREQTELFTNALRSIQPEVARIDEELYNID